MLLNRRSCLQTLLGSTLTWTATRRTGFTASPAASIKFAVITDVHQDIMHDGPQRLEVFAESIQDKDLDFVIQLGDFCIPKPANREFLQRFTDCHPQTYHVLGNHDMDGGYRREQTVEYYGMPDRYYAFEHRGLHVIVLDGNDPGGQQPGYRRFIAPDQLAWLEQELQESSLPSVIFSHQPLNHGQGVENFRAVQRVLEAFQSDPSRPGLLGCFSGHFHLNHFEMRGRVPYAQINSASYYWVGSKFAHQSYSEAIHESRPHLASTCPYRDPLWAIVEIDLEQGRVEMTGRQTEWVGPSPAELEVPAGAWSENQARAARISDRTWNTTPPSR